MWLQLLTLLTLIALTGLTLWLRRRLEGDEAPLRVLAHRRLDAQHALWLVEVDGHRLLLGGGRAQLSLLKELGE
ncbi:flagellar biosynthetic protein FliO [Myxococcota bacterium]|nr:flagellar biosynthetic protein FliO [Myxococcota bacterium]MBU1432486.1 flagellar biosynthetic protein FliO [Myxococcota bacterium]MBU1899646.1 flagellar biosynthetic protein FliO [Myxococcota bacterium]